MNGFLEACRQGGIFMVLIAVWGAVFFTLLLLQFRKRRSNDFTWVLWGILLSLLALGPLGTAVGLRQSVDAVALMQAASPTVLLVKLWQVLGIALVTTVFSTLLTVLGAIPLGLVTHQVRGRRLSDTGGS
jgi:UDP-N-acetylmuramyl pentapeptide phosphotransferase/UDP-N-acetylglucosamine-1-phosphate transferase